MMTGKERTMRMVGIVTFSTLTVFCLASNFGAWSLIGFVFLLAAWLCAIG